MDINSILKDAIGPYGAMFLLIVGIAYLWHKLETTNKSLLDAQSLLRSQQDLFAQALSIIKDDLVPLVERITRKHP